MILARRVENPSEKAGILARIVEKSLKKGSEFSWECWKIVEKGSQKTRCFDNDGAQVLCFARVIFWKVRHYELKSLVLEASGHRPCARTDGRIR